MGFAKQYRMQERIDIHRNMIDLFPSHGRSFHRLSHAYLVYVEVELELHHFQTVY